MSSSNNKRWGKTHKDNRDWPKYNEELVAIDVINLLNCLNCGILLKNGMN